MLRPSGVAARVAGLLLGAAVAAAETALVVPASGGAGDFRVVRWTTAEGLPQNIRPAGEVEQG